METMHTVHLHGKLATIYGNEPINIFGSSLRDVVQGLIANLGKGFENTIKNGQWHITRGKRKNTCDNAMKEDIFMSNIEVDFPVFDEEIHIFPVIAGAGKFGQIIIGVVLIIVAIVLIFTGVGAWLGGYIGAAAVSSLAGGIAAAGIAAVAGGIVQLLQKSPSINYDNAETDRKPSFLYNGVVNVVEQGGPVPLVYGLHMAGSTVISASVSTQNVNDFVGNILTGDNATFDTSVGSWTPYNCTINSVDGELEVSSSGAPDSQAELIITPEPGNSYAVTVSYRTDSTTSVQLLVEDDVTTFDQIISGPSEVMKNISVIWAATIPTGNVKIRLRNLGIVGSTVYFDNVTLTGGGS